MARFMIPTKQDQDMVDARYRDRPRHVRAIFNRLDFFELYGVKTTGHRAMICAIEDDGTVAVRVSRRFNDIIYDIMMFGVDPDDLVPCELPTSEEVSAMKQPDQDNAPARTLH